MWRVVFSAVCQVLFFVCVVLVCVQVECGVWIDLLYLCL